MDNGNSKDSKDTQEIIIQSNSYNVTVIPVDFSNRNRLYNSQTTEYMNDQYRDEYLATDNGNVNQNNLYSVAQRLPSANGNYCSDAIHTVKNYSAIQNQWNNEKIIVTTEGKSTEHGFEDFNENQNEITKSSTSTANTLASSSNTAPVIEPFQEPVIPMCVYLHNKTVIMMEIEDTPSATCELICQAIINSEELALNRVLATQVFTLWMISPLLELQLKPYSKPYEIRERWRYLIDKYAHASDSRKEKDEPKLVFQRNMFFSRHLEEKLKDQKILELLYEECKYNILNGRYPSEIPHLIMLGGIQAREELGPYNPQVHNTHFFREEQSKFLPAHVRKSPSWTWLPISSKNSAEVRLLEQFKRIPNTATNRKLIKKYLEYCWSLPFYGAAFFEGQIEEPVRGLISLLTHQDIPVLIAINSRGLYIIDDSNSEIVLGLKYEEFSWDYTKPSREDNPDCLPCLFIQFMVMENGARVSKMLQVFSRQASLMDTLINSYVSELTAKANDEVDNKMYDNQASSDNDNQPSTVGNHIYPSNYSVLSNKLNKLTLATFDDNGHCIGQMGSWSFSY
ncbi:putative FERM domain-containing protein FRMD8P1 [Sitophilus oryzae]|uniref:FERM domain-containing protein 8 n=1 Tax=Sitophilus oryzae TaxID=7048 RepID=A0A6J2YPG7_SITOR|nr:putative FERM domain-containing protein FRMD8P1 [Sitophilus oryzae]